MSSSKNKTGTKNLKQGNLFSFFSKKPASTINKKPSSVNNSTKALSQSSSIVSKDLVTPATTKNEASSPVRSSKSNPESVGNELWKGITPGCRVSVYWKEDEEYYDAIVIKQRGSSSRFQLKYDDGETELVDMSQETFKFVKASTQAKRRRVIDPSDDEEEHEWNDEEEEQASSDDDGSVYEAPKDGEDDDDDDEEDDWLVDDDEEEEDDVIEEEDDGYSPPPKKKRKMSAKRKSLKVTKHRPVTSTTTTATTTTTMVGDAVCKTPLRQFANTVSPSTNSSRKSVASTSTTTTVPRRLHSGSNSAADLGSTSSIPMFVRNAVNAKGSHIHNHLKFLRNPRDSKGRCMDEPGYDGRTLKVDHREWERLDGKKMTNAVQQWWELKSRYFDTVLLFKTGKFYEMFHMDADIGVDVCNFIYMKGHVAHSGFPEISYGIMADKLVRAGYKVARVEQTETPEQLKIRKQRAPTGKKPQVVNREVCSILTLGTRTFCCLDDPDALSNSVNNGAGVGPLLSIREVLTVDDENIMETDNDVDQVKAICEYGVTLVDAVNGSITIGQFADDVLRSRMNTLLAAFGPSEILVQAGEENESASPTLLSLIKAYQANSRNVTRVETVLCTESFPKSTALDSTHRRLLERKTPYVHPWDVEETIQELHRRGYYPRGSRKEEKNISRWPKILQAAVTGNADLCISSLGAALFYLQRNLIDQEILGMGIVKAYVPPESSCISEDSDNTKPLVAVMQQQDTEIQDLPQQQSSLALDGIESAVSAEGQIKNMSLDGTTLHNLEILTNVVDHKPTGSLWSKINYTKTPHGARLLKAWLLRPLFRKSDIERRADAVQELVSGAGAVALTEARQDVLRRIGDLDRLLSRVHSMGGPTDHNNVDEGEGYHPSERAVLYEGATYTKRKVGDFSKLLNGLRRSCQIPDLFADLQLQEGGLLQKIVRYDTDGGFFPRMVEELDWYFDNFDCDKAAKGEFEPSRGCDEAYDDACDTIDRIRSELEEYRQEMCNELRPRHTAKSSWKYINIKPDSKDKYLIELPASVEVPPDFVVKGKRGKGLKQVNKYRTPTVARLVHELEQAIEVQKIRKAKGMQLIFAKFDSQRSLWSAAAHATANLDAIGSLAKAAGKPGYCRPTILDCPPDTEPTINIVQGRHPCVEGSINSTEFIPNDLSLGRSDSDTNPSSRLLLLSGPNMGGKSTLLRQTCLIAILAQIGSYVPAEECQLTPIDCIYTRLGAADRILVGQSTFFVELAETAAALRGATRRSLVIMDELGRGTSTFDGTAIAGATVKHLVERSQCLSLFATHYHSLLAEWEHEPMVRLGHMQCLVEDGDDEESNNDNSHITFLYTLGPGTCPKSFGVNVARLASLPEQVLVNAKRVSEEFEEEMNNRNEQASSMEDLEMATEYKQRIMTAINNGNWDGLEQLWKELTNLPITS